MFVKVDPSTVAGSEAYVLFYRKNSDNVISLRRELALLDRETSDSLGWFFSFLVENKVRSEFLQQRSVKKTKTKKTLFDNLNYAIFSEILYIELLAGEIPEHGRARGDRQLQCVLPTRRGATSEDRLRGPALHRSTPAGLEDTL